MTFVKGHPQYGHTKKGTHHARTRARAAGKARALKELEITAERTMRELGRVGFSDVGALFDDAGQLAPLKALPASVRATVASVKTLKTNLVSGDGAQEVTREVKLWDKMSALNTLAKHFGLVTDKQDVTHHASEDMLEVLNAFKRGNRQP